MRTATQNKKVDVPFMCKDKDEFIKAMLVISTSLPTVSKDLLQGVFVDMFKMLAHDYHALVNRGEMEPYEFSADNEAYKEMRDMFEKSMRDCNIALGCSGVPMMETDDGKLAIDWDNLEKENKDE